MRRLPTNKSPKHNLIIELVDEFFGEGYSPAQKKLKKNIALWLMNRKRGVVLNEEQKQAVWYIRINIADYQRQNTL